MSNPLSSGKLTDYLLVGYDYQSGGFFLANFHPKADETIKFLKDQTVKILIFEHLGFMPKNEHLFELPKVNLVYNPKQNFGIIPNSKKETGFTLFNFHFEPNFEVLKSEALQGYRIPNSILTLLKNLFENEEGIKYSLYWLANMVQRNKNEIALLLFGRTGTGKGTFASLISQLIGDRNVANLNNKSLESGWNSEVVNKRCVFFNEIKAYSKNKGIASTLKEYITDEHLQAYVKFRDSYKAKNLFSVVITTNEKAPIQIEFDDRRYSIFKSKDVLPNHIASQVKNLSDNELMLFKSYLFNLDLSNWDSRKPFVNLTKKKMMYDTNTKREVLIHEITHLNLDEIMLSILKADSWDSVDEDDDSFVDSYFEKLILRTSYEKDFFVSELKQDFELLQHKKILSSRFAVILYREAVGSIDTTTTSIGRFYSKYFGKSVLFRTQDDIFKGYKVELFKEV